MSEKSDWEQGYDQAMRRTYEQRIEARNRIAELESRIAELEEFIGKLIEAGDEMSDQSYWHEIKWQALVKDWKERER